MSLKATWFRDRLRKKSKRGFQGFPVGTIAYYGPNAERASKGIALPGEPANAGRLISLGLIVAGIVGLKFSTPVQVIGHRSCHTPNAQTHV